MSLTNFEKPKTEKEAIAKTPKADFEVQQHAAKKSTKPYAGVEHFVYYGPSLPKERLQKNDVLKGTYEEICKYYADVLKKHPNASKYIVPVAKLAEIRNKKTSSLLDDYSSDLYPVASKEG